MTPFSESLVVSMAVVLQLGGLASTLLARLTEGSPFESWCQRVFLASLLLMAVATIATWQCRDYGYCWIGCCATLAAMAIAATMEVGQSARSPGF